MATNQYYFKELDVRDTFKNDLEDIFLTDEVYTELGTEVYIITGGKQELTTFPCIFVDITNSSVTTRYSSNTEIQRLSNFTISFDIYSKDLDKYNQDDAVIKIAEILVDGIQKKYHSLVMTLNQALPNLDTTVSRKQVRFEGVMDNKSNFIYSN